MPSTQTIFPALTKDDFLAQEREHVPKRVTMTVMSANVLRWLGGLSTIPDAMLEAGRAVLGRAQQDGAIRDYRLYALGSDLVMQITTLGQGLHNSKIGALASKVVTTALTCAAEAHVYHPIAGEGEHGLKKGLGLKRWLKGHAQLRLAFPSIPDGVWRTR